LEEAKVRTLFPKTMQTQATPIQSVSFQLHCRHELIPILVALQHLYGRAEIVRELLRLIATDINKNTKANVGRPGLSYWEILVLAAVRLGCNCDYDALQDLAENHRTLRQILGVADESLDTHHPSPYLWQRLRDNLCCLQPHTLEQINHCLVSVGHELQPAAAEHVRGDCFVVETNIHFPTEANLLADGLRKILDLARDLNKLLPLPGWRQQDYWRQQLKKALRYVNRAYRSKGKNAPALRRRSYQALYDLTEQLLTKGRDLEQQVQMQLAGATVNALLHGLHQQLHEFLAMTGQVVNYSKRRVLHEEKIANGDKIFSLFEPHTQLIKRGKQPYPIQFGHNLLIVEDAVGFICHYRILDNAEAEEEIVVAEMVKLKKRMPKVKTASFDRGFHTPGNQQQLSEVIPVVCLPMRGAKKGKKQMEQASAAFKEARRAHPGIEALIGVLQRGHGLKRCRDRTLLGYQRYVGLAILGRNLHTLGRLLLSQQHPGCLASRTQRKPFADVA
jgi:IS5 family transposase